MKLLEHISRAWCRKFHGKPYTPMYGRYRCMVCLREYKVDWPVTHQAPRLTGIEREWREADEQVAELKRMYR